MYPVRAGNLQARIVTLFVWGALFTCRQELEASRLQGQQAQDKVAHHVKLEEEAKARCAALQQDVAR